jgi:F-type H+-transporting ATPase subunit c
MIGGNAMQAISRQPEATGDIRASMLIAAAFVEAVALFACVIAIIK